MRACNLCRERTADWYHFVKVFGVVAANEPAATCAKCREKHSDSVIVVLPVIGFIKPRRTRVSNS